VMHPSTDRERGGGEYKRPAQHSVVGRVCSWSRNNPPSDGTQRIEVNTTINKLTIYRKIKLAKSLYSIPCSIVMVSAKTFRRGEEQGER
jgi:hypothetical protein